MSEANDTVQGAEPGRLCPSCADRQLLAERKLQIIADNRISDMEAMEMVSILVDEAGPANAKLFMERADAVPF